MLPAELMCNQRTHGTSKLVSIHFVAATPHKLTQRDPNDEGQHVSEHGLRVGMKSRWGAGQGFITANGVTQG